MIGREMLSMMFAHSAWANAKILDCAGKVTDEQWNDAGNLIGRSLHEILHHSMGAELVWFTACETGIRLAKRPPITDFPTVDSIRTRWEQQQAGLQAFIAGLTDEALAGQIEVRNQDGAVAWSMTRWHMLMTAALHNVQHRAEAAALLTKLGQSPGDLDFVLYTRS